MANLSFSSYTMSKGNMFFGKARGKLGDIVLFVRNGEQVQRPYNGNPKNPRSISQMKQRVKLASVVGFYKRQSAFFRFALKKKPRESYYNAFVRYNLNIAPYLTKEQAALGYQIAAPYIIADGDMPTIGVTSVTVDISNELDFKLSVNSSLNTWGAFRRAYNLLMGDMISFVIFNRSTDSTSAAQRIVAQHVFDQESENMPFGYDVVGLRFEPGGDNYQISVDKKYFNVSEWYSTAVACVISRNAGGVDCSFAQLVLSENAEAEYLVFHSDEQHEEAAASYGKIDSAILDPKSFEGNYVDMLQLYSDAQRTQPVSVVSLSGTTPKTLYFNSTEVSGAVMGDIKFAFGPELLDDFNPNFQAGTLLLSSTGEESGVAGININWKDEEGNIIKSSFLTVSASV